MKEEIKQIFELYFTDEKCTDIKTNNINFITQIHNFSKIYVTEQEEPYAVAEEWERPIDWIPIPEIASGEQVIYGLMAIFEEDINYYIC